MSRQSVKDISRYPLAFSFQEALNEAGIMISHPHTFNVVIEWRHSQRWERLSPFHS